MFLPCHGSPFVDRKWGDPKKTWAALENRDSNLQSNSWWLQLDPYL